MYNTMCSLFGLQELKQTNKQTSLVLVQTLCVNPFCTGWICALHGHPLRMH